MLTELFIVGLLLILLGGAVVPLLRNSRNNLSTLPVYCAMVGCSLLFICAVTSLIGFYGLDIAVTWQLPGASLSFGIDPISGLFLIPITLLGFLTSVYGVTYMKHSGSRRDAANSFFFFNVLIASMVVVVVARNSILFLLAWECMALSSFFLVTFENRHEESRTAGWIYLSATHVGTAFLIVMFMILHVQTDSFDFGATLDVSHMPASIANVLFVFSLIGFGTKSGLVPSHVWLPEAHPAAPSHVSALMSGAMIKTGAYGMVVVLSMFNSPPSWWGWTLISVGALSGILGILNACIQVDLKRVLAYSSVENIGIVFIGLGMGTLGRTYGVPLLTALGYAGAFLHIINHALFKGMLFLGAGSVLYSTGTRSLDQLGGLLKRMRWTGNLFLLGSAAIVGLPPFNGFVSEFLIFLGAFGCLSNGQSDSLLMASLLVIGSLAVISGLALLAFTRAYGIAFLGEPRSESADKAREVPLSMLLPIIVLGLLCLVIGAYPIAIVPLVSDAISAATGVNMMSESLGFFERLGSLSQITSILVFFAVIAVLLVVLRSIMMRGAKSGRTVTWDCGYAKPAASMQYTSTSFSHPLATFLGVALGERNSVPRIADLFPATAGLTTRVRDLIRSKVYDPLFSIIEKSAHRLRHVQQGRVQIYVLYVVITLVVLLVLKLG